MLNVKILLVDDDPDFCCFMEQILTHDGAQVITTGSCQEALRLFEAQRPDLVFLDVHMLDGDGFETCRRLRRRSDVPIIMLSAIDLTEYEVKGLACGADDYIAKSIDLIVLRARMRAVLRRAGYTLASPGAGAPARTGRPVRSELIASN